MLTLAEGGRARLPIVVSATASPPERHAAEELARFLHAISGAEFPILSPNADRNGPSIAVGADAALAVGLAPYEFEGLGEEGIRIRTLGSEHLVLTGAPHAPRGTLYAVYSFLEDVLGCRWWSSKASTIPRRETLAIPPLDVRYVPPLEYRESFWYDAFDGDWAVRNKSNGHSVRTDAARGGHHVYKGFVHTFYPLVPPERHFAEHPEWYSEINGERTYERAQLCLTNEELLQFVIERVKEWIRESPEATIVSVSQNDWHGYCTCERCRAVDEEEGSHAGTLLRFVNAVAEAIEEEFPHVAIDTLAYQYTRKPPQKVRPRHNVIVRLCSIECNFLEPLTHESNRSFREDIEGWSKICNRLYIWDYTTNFRNYVLPHPNYYVLGENIRFFVRHGVKGIFEQGAYQSYGSEMAELRAWVLAKLLWRPELDDRELIAEFLEGYYGPAAPHIEAYMKRVYRSAKERGIYLRCFVPHDAPFLTADLLLELTRHLEAAEQAVWNDPERRPRVQVAKLAVWYPILLRWEEVRQRAAQTGQGWLLPEDRIAAFEAFARIYQEHGMTHLAEHRERNLDWLRSQCQGES